MTVHAQLSPSSAVRWMQCPGSVALSEGINDEGSEYAKEGTAAHELAELVLKSGAADADKYVGKRAENGVEFNDDMANFVMQYVNRIRDFAKGNELFVEQRLSIAHITQEEDAAGTSDAVILTPTEIQVHDLKYGMGVKVDAEDNEQLMIYALAALREYDILGDFTHARMVIHQPRLNHVSEWSIPIEQLKAFGDKAAKAALNCHNASDLKPVLNIENWSDQYLNPSDDACRWCKAKADCPKLREFVLSKVTGEDLVDCTEPLAPVLEAVTPPTDNAVLANCLSAVDLIESWCTAIRGKVNAELREGREVPGYKLVQGRKGARAWINDAEAEAMMKSMRLKIDEMYDMKVISPTKTEKVLADKPKCWKRIEGLIVQAEGGLAVAPLSDKRPAVTVQKEEFYDESAADGLV